MCPAFPAITVPYRTGPPEDQGTHIVLWPGMSHQVFLIRDAVSDLEELDEYLATGESAKKADYVLNKIEAVLQRLAESTERGRRSRELLALGLDDYRQVFFNPYRIIYTLRHNDVYVLLIADGRRDIETLLQNRLLAF